MRSELNSQSTFEASWAGINLRESRRNATIITEMNCVAQLIERRIEKKNAASP